MTETEALSKWCPLTFNRDNPQSRGWQHCVGRDCMAFVTRRVPQQTTVDDYVETVMVEDCHCGLVKQVW